MSNIVNILINYGLYGIMAAAFAEAIFMPVPMELISIPVFLVTPSMAFLYSIILITFSFLGSIAGYFAGKFLSRPLQNKFSSSENFIKLKKLYTKNSFLAVLTSAFTPIPYEAYVLSAGVFDIGLPRFMLASLISRIIRHLPQGILISLYGDALLKYNKTYVLWFGLGVFLIIAMGKYLWGVMNSTSPQ